MPLSVRPHLLRHKERMHVLAVCGYYLGKHVRVSLLFFPLGKVGPRLPVQHSLGELGSGGSGSWIWVRFSISCSSGDAAPVKIPSVKSSRLAQRQCRPRKSRVFSRDSCMPSFQLLPKHPLCSELLGWSEPPVGRVCPGSLFYFV